MRVVPFLFILISGLFTPGMMSSAILLWSGCAIAQVTSDGTTNTIINQNGNNFTILNGMEKGNNLFHSFSNFSVPTGGSATFNLTNTPNITTIFSRVTGGNVSNIDGLIRTLNSNNPVSLFLINPAGIVFGPNAALNIGGSFIGTTANSIKFADGTEFSAANPTSLPLLTLSVPIGLQLGSNPGAIAVQGTGYTLPTNSSGPTKRTMSPTELRVQPGNTLALVGNNLNLNGARLTAEQGHIELGSVGGAGMVSLVTTAQGYTLGYGNGQSFSDIQLVGRSLLDVSGVNAGSVQVQGQHLQFADSSLVLAQNSGNRSGGDLLLQASAGIDLTGLNSGVRSETLGSGTSGNINVITPRLSLQQGAGLSSNTYGKATSGNVQVDAAAVEISGFSPLSTLGSFIATSTSGSGSAGNIAVNGDSLLVSDGGGLSSVTQSSGNSGQVFIHNLDTIVRSSNSAPISSRISSGTFSSGNANTLTLDTARLQLVNGGGIGTSSFAVGKAGDLEINATESILISGRSETNVSLISSSVMYLNPARQKRFGLVNYQLTADAGAVSLITPNLILKDGGTVSVTNEGSGHGGSINITTDTIQLKNQAFIEAKTASGNGGNINLQIDKLVLLRNDSQITATAGGNGNGGNITINAPIIAGLENSDIVANAVKGNGGNIAITTQGIFGLEYRTQLTSENDITASSQFGVNGIVEVNTIGVDPNSGLVELPENVTDQSQQIATGCSNNTSSSFVATGRGGIPQNPTQQVGSDVYDGLRLRTWSDIRDISAYRKTGEVMVQIPPAPETLIQATSWHRSAQGKIELVADKSPTQVQQPLTCAAVPKS